MTANGKVRTAILGASGYTGAELLRLAAGHGAIEIAALTADRNAGEPIAAVFPQLAALDLPVMTRIDDVDWSAIDAAFCCLPHGITQEVVAGLPRHVRVVDLSADFRLADITAYREWYKGEHRAPALQPEAVYGLTELKRDAIRDARLVANPGCYPTPAQLALVPLVADGLVEADDIVIDAKSGVTGAGRALKETSLFAEVAEGINAYGIAGHRHMPEVEQGLSEAAGRPVRISFTPHLMPMNRGILETIYLKAANGADAAAIRARLAAAYEDEPFVRLVPQGQAPATRHVRGSNLCLMGVFEDRIPGRVIVIAAIDNLVKGAAGQALQNLNVMMGLDETAGLQAAPIYP